MNHLTANELKRGGVTVIEQTIKDSADAAVTIDVRGRAKYVILPIEAYDKYREYELDNAIAEAQTCYEVGDVEEVKDFDALAKQLQNL
ncbi:hypothetical protein AADZ86_04305 [Colwelliaceae bacterium BS250]